MICQNAYNSTKTRYNIICLSAGLNDMVSHEVLGRMCNSFLLPKLHMWDIIRAFGNLCIPYNALALVIDINQELVRDNNNKWVETIQRI
jgi:hypothetical protein